ncbi:MAG: dihydroorotase [Syntrophorhabdaceae bacterium]|nr:dihydroorotase [Syntrophorhabdaceae bacterium]MDD4196374.1 dihydroorotase [Syntrophorhabdaceae bacterium]
MKTLIRGGHLIDPKTSRDGIYDILIEDSVIREVSDAIRKTDGKTQVVDASGCIVAPGLIDVHCHLREPGFEYKETILTGTSAAVRGGFTTIVCMANTDPVNDSRSVTEFIIDKARTEGKCKVLPCGAITRGLKGEELAEIGEMFSAGIIAISDDGRSVRNAGLMRKALEYAKTFKIPVISHCEDTMLSGGYVHEGTASLLNGLEGIPAIAEELMVQRDIAIARYVDAPIHITHISTGGSVDIIQTARKTFRKVACDTCPHYFSLTDEATLTFDTNTKVNPPLRSGKDVEAIKEGLRKGVIDIIATDHAPHEYTSKDVEFDLATFGISGFETAFALSLNLVREGVLDMAELLKKMTANPAKLLGVDSGTIAEGAPADIIIFDPDREWTVDRNLFLSKGKNTPFHGAALRGRNLFTMVDGKIMFNELK